MQLCFSRALVAASLFAVAACGDDTDSGQRPIQATDGSTAAVADAAVSAVDGSVNRPPPPPDAGAASDGGHSVDAGALSDGGVADAGPVDAGSPTEDAGGGGVVLDLSVVCERACIRQQACAPDVVVPESCALECEAALRDSCDDAAVAAFSACLHTEACDDASVDDQAACADPEVCRAYQACTRDALVACGPRQVTDAGVVPLPDAGSAADAGTSPDAGSGGGSSATALCQGLCGRIASCVGQDLVPPDCVASCADYLPVACTPAEIATYQRCLDQPSCEDFEECAATIQCEPGEETDAGVPGSSDASIPVADGGGAGRPADAGSADAGAGIDSLCQNFYDRAEVCFGSGTLPATFPAECTSYASQCTPADRAVYQACADEAQCADFGDCAVQLLQNPICAAPDAGASVDAGAPSDASTSVSPPADICTDIEDRLVTCFGAGIVDPSFQQSCTDYLAGSCNTEERGRFQACQNRASCQDYADCVSSIQCGAPSADAGTPASDAGAPVSDGGAGPADAGVADASTGNPGGELSGTELCERIFDCAGVPGGALAQCAASLQSSLDQCSPADRTILRDCTRNDACPAFQNCLEASACLSAP